MQRETAKHFEEEEPSDDGRHDFPFQGTRRRSQSDKRPQKSSNRSPNGLETSKSYRLESSKSNLEKIEEEDSDSGNEPGGVQSKGTSIRWVRSPGGGAIGTAFEQPSAVSAKYAGLLRDQEIVKEEDNEDDDEEEKQAKGPLQGRQDEEQPRRGASPDGGRACNTSP